LIYAVACGNGYDMPKARLALIAAVVVALVWVPFLFLVRSSSTGITLHYAGSEAVVGGVVITIAITNHTGRAYHLRTVRFETRDGNIWNQHADGISGMSVAEVQPNSDAKLRCVVKPLPPGTHVRLVMLGHRTEDPLYSFLWRVKVWRAGNANFSYLFDTKPILFRERADLISDEFVP
jgi:hypothetical protein